MLGPATELVYETPRRFSGRSCRRRRIAVHRHRQRRARVPASTRKARARRSSTPPSSRRTRSRPRPTAACTSAARPTARSTRSIATGTATTFFDPEREVHLGAGDRCQGQPVRRHRREGHRLPIAPDGKGTRFYQAKATHATALAFDRAGNLLVGTESPGRVLRVDRRGQGLRAARLAVSGDPRAAVRRQGHAVRRGGERPRRSGARAAPRPTIARRTAVGRRRARRWRRSRPRSRRCGRRRVRRRSSSDDVAREDRRAAKGAVYRIAPDGLWDQLWESREDSPYDLVFDAEGRSDRRHRQQGQDLPAGRRPAAADAARRRRRAAGDGAFTRTRAAACTSRRRIPASCSASLATRAARGTYESEPRDAQMVADVGRDQLARHDAVRQPHRDLHAVGQHRDAGRHLEPVVVGVHRSRRARRSPAPRRVIFSGAPCSTARTRARC